MALDIFAIEPNVISRDLSEKSMLIYGFPKTGKTTNACKFPKPLLVAFEKGFGAINGIRPAVINKWKDFLDVKKQLIKDADAVKKGEKTETFYTTVILDTLDIAYNYANDYILSLEGVTALEDTKNMGGYKKVEREFEMAIIDLMKAGYCVIGISHTDMKQMKDGVTGEKYDRIQPTLDKRGLKVASRAMDIIMFAQPESMEDGTTQTFLYMRGSKELEAGSRFKYTSARIPFTYQAIVDDITHAIDMIEKEDGVGSVVDKKGESVYVDTSPLDYNTLMVEVKELGVRFHQAEKLAVFNKVAEDVVGCKLTLASDKQTEAIATAIDKLKDIATELGI